MKAHQRVLSFLGVQEYVLSSSTEQTIFVSPNREGLASLMEEERVPITLEIINQNSLAIFLFANLLTGIINLSVHSMYINPVPAFSILQLYSACIVAFAYLIRNIKISL
ncbi:hypothetical protein PSHT_03651 [Puccinia striiformis]|uniref:GPI-anchored wall transfer protein 1 n=1 Tax=Puccinia striiformis TaxID=27350 RepID=A0A2S4WEW7_9BASI|nr:hypothetical protein PSHT_03651 [Puccinia striiformis]